LKIFNIISQFIIKFKIFVVIAIIFFFTFAIYWKSLPIQLFRDPYSTVIFADNGQLLGATVTSDGQWRFPAGSKISDKYKKALLVFEDNQFYHHPGVNPYSLLRAIWTNIRVGKIVAGGSTISMQTIRLSRKGKNRNYAEKFIEIIKATRLEISYSKHQILELYAAHAPFGGNTIGLQAASWRYFGRSADNLSWAEATTLAILPNAPALIHPGRNRSALLKKRDRLLRKLFRKKYIDNETLELALAEPLPERPLDIPQLAPHLLHRIFLDQPQGSIVKTTIDPQLQIQVNSIIERYINNLRTNFIYNVAVVVANIESGKILAYVGNTKSISNEDHSNDVDIITSHRSTGSILKPFLYASMLDVGEILPASLIPDVPVIISGYSPKNFSSSYDGAVHAQRALARSLNVPAVLLLKQYGVKRFYDLLQNAGMSTLTRSSDDYGLSLILGGAEGSLWDICNMYTGLARSLKYYAQRSDRYTESDFHFLHFDNNKPNISNERLEEKGIIGAGAIWHTFNAMLEVNKPEQESGWEYYLSAWKVAWKTGTSFGFRDAWAVGLNSHFIVGVWVGNADGTGRPGLTGVDCAAPLMFEVFRELNTFGWFTIPSDDLEKAIVCRKSGFLATENCPETDTIFVPPAGLNSRPCSFHKIINLDNSGKYRVSSLCESVYNMKQKKWFVLPPVQEIYYRKKDPSYIPLPPYKKGCQPDARHVMDFIYPNENAVIFLPVNMDKKRESVVFRLAHHNSDAIVYWHLDGLYAGQTQNVHQLAINPGQGKHVITVVDEDGNVLTRKFEVLSK
jgi:penicillin-binding protein 1C